MRDRNSIRLTIILLGIAIIGFGYLTVNKFQKLNDVSEIKSNVNKLNLEYKSHRSFGNDRFDIYSFSLKENNKNIRFKTYDEKIEEEYQSNFKNFVDKIGDNDNTKNYLKSDIERIKKEKDISYMYFKSDATQKLYLYSKRSNKGYCLILTI